MKRKIKESTLKIKPIKSIKYWGLLQESIVYWYGLKNGFILSHVSNVPATMMEIDLKAKQLTNKKHKYIAVIIDKFLYQGCLEEMKSFEGETNMSIHSFDLIQGQDCGWYELVVKLNPDKFIKTESTELIKEIMKNLNLTAKEITNDNGFNIPVKYIFKTKTNNYGILKQ